MARQGLCSLDEIGPSATTARPTFSEAPTARDLLGHDALNATRKTSTPYLRPRCADQTDEYDAISIGVIDVR